MINRTYNVSPNQCVNENHVSTQYLPDDVAGKNCAIVGGSVKIDEAKITGTTPAGLTLIGRYVWLSFCRFSPCPVCWIGILLSEFSNQPIMNIARSAIEIYRKKFITPMKICDDEPLIGT